MAIWSLPTDSNLRRWAFFDTDLGVVDVPAALVALDGIVNGHVMLVSSSRSLYKRGRCFVGRVTASAGAVATKGSNANVRCRTAFVLEFLRRYVTVDASFCLAGRSISIEPICSMVVPPRS